MNGREWRAFCGAAVRLLSPAAFERLTIAKLNRGEKSYSQEGEDRILARYFDSVNNGFYVDVGAHHPIRFSNTMLFYKRGWRGVNIDAMPGSMRLFDVYRRSDTNIEAGIGSMADEVPFFIFNEPALNSFDEMLSRSRENGRYKIVDVVKVPVRPLSTVLMPYLQRLKGPSFLTVDAEGRDLDVLKSNDWTVFRPTFVLAECLGTTLDNLLSSDVARFLRSKGYTVVAKTLNTVFFRSNDCATLTPA